ncbi:hypothetical protein HHK36_020109 [Tetracentron sinense]|uniref:CMP-sialic acid transporter 3 n=1 Tax=Tetracentron sinense TaxID=13715 RepID=A0A834YR19_TETSI|nr:hypothetical protein HHK36_020109 [Tetracentron sinense]
MWLRGEPAKNGVMECSVCHSKLVSPTTKTVSRAYDRHRSKISSKYRALNVLLVVGDCILVGLQPILVFMSKVDGNFKFSPISVNFLTEVAKVIFATVMLIFQARHQKVGEKPLLSVSTFVQAARNNVLLAVPALLYAINNYLKFTMQLYFNPATVKMLSNLKVLVIAVLLKIIMRRRFSIIQWEALALLLIGISVNQMRSLPEGTSALGLPIATGAYMYTLIFDLNVQVTVPSLASVFNEYALKSQFETSIYLQVLVIAVLLKIIMRRRFSIIQWEALALLLIGISVNQMRSLPEGTSALGLPIATGAYMYTLIFDLNVQVTVPSLASVFNEYALKSQFETSIYLQNFFLYGYGAIFNFLAILGTAVIKGPSSFDILQGHSKATMFLIFNNAAQGILSSFFFKYADTILKKYSSTVATIFTGIASAAMFGHTLTINFVLGISIVFISMHQFFSHLSKAKDEPQNGALEMMDVQTNHGSKDSSFINMAAGANDDATHHVGPDERQPLLPI